MPILLWTSWLALIATGAAVALVTTGQSSEAHGLFLDWQLVAAVAERGRVRLTQYLEESISLLPILFAAVVFGPLAAMVVAAASMLGAFGSPYLKWATYTAARSLTGAATGLAATWATGFSSTHIASVAVATTVGALVSQVLDACLAALTLKVRNTGKQVDFLRTLGPLVFLAVPFYAPLVAALAFAYRDVSPWTLPLFFGPALAAQRLFGLYQEARRSAEDLSSANRELHGVGGTSTEDA